MAKMVKSYTGVRAAPPSKLIQEVQVQDYMTTRNQLVTFRPDQPIGKVVAIMLHRRLDGGPVLDADGKMTYTPSATGNTATFHLIPASYPIIW